MQPLDGNAIAGLLWDAFGQEMTAVLATCGACGSVAAVAEGMVYPHVPGTVLRCRHCSGVLIVITQIHGCYCVDTQGLAALTVPRAD
jgi:hypothetical protein